VSLNGTILISIVVKKVRLLINRWKHKITRTESTVVLQFTVKYGTIYSHRQRKGLFAVTGNTHGNGVICVGTSIKSRDVEPYNHNNTTNAVGTSDLAYFGIDSSLIVI